MILLHRTLVDNKKPLSVFCAENIIIIKYSSHLGLFDQNLTELYKINCFENIIDLYVSSEAQNLLNNQYIVLDNQNVTETLNFSKCCVYITVLTPISIMVYSCTCAGYKTIVNYLHNIKNTDINTCKIAYFSSYCYIILKNKIIIKNINLLINDCELDYKYKNKLNKPSIRMNKINSRYNYCNNLNIINNKHSIIDVISTAFIIHNDNLYVSTSNRVLIIKNNKIIHYIDINDNIIKFMCIKYKVYTSCLIAISNTKFYILENEIITSQNISDIIKKYIECSQGHDEYSLYDTYNDDLDRLNVCNNYNDESDRLNAYKYYNSDFNKYNNIFDKHNNIDDNNDNEDPNNSNTSINNKLYDNNTFEYKLIDKNYIFQIYSSNIFAIIDQLINGNTIYRYFIPFIEYNNIVITEVNLNFNAKSICIVNDILCGVSDNGVFSYKNTNGKYSLITFIPFCTIDSIRFDNNSSNIEHKTNTQLGTITDCKINKDMHNDPSCFLSYLTNLTLFSGMNRLKLKIEKCQSKITIESIENKNKLLEKWNVHLCNNYDKIQQEYINGVKNNINKNNLYNTKKTYTFNFDQNIGCDNKNTCVIPGLTETFDSDDNEYNCIFDNSLYTTVNNNLVWQIKNKNTIENINTKTKFNIGENILDFVLHKTMFIIKNDKKSLIIFDTNIKKIISRHSFDEPILKIKIIDRILAIQFINYLRLFHLKNNKILPFFRQLNAYCGYYKIKYISEKLESKYSDLNLMNNKLDENFISKSLNVKNIKMQNYLHNSENKTNSEMIIKNDQDTIQYIVDNKIILVAKENTIHAFITEKNLNGIKTYTLIVYKNSKQLNKILNEKPISIKINNNEVYLGFNKSLKIFLIGNKCILQKKLLCINYPKQIFIDKDFMIIQNNNMHIYYIRHNEVIFRDKINYNIVAFCVYNRYIILGTDSMYIIVYKDNICICSIYIDDIPISLNIFNNNIIYYCKNGTIGKLKEIKNTTKYLFEINSQRFSSKNGQFGVYDADSIIENFNIIKKYIYGDDDIYKILQALYK